MKREFKFRFWHAVENKMYSGDELTLHFPGGVSIWRTLSIEPEIDAPGELMQWTGLQDVTGQDIYEGDIVKRGEGLPMTGKESEHVPFAPHRVYFNEGAFRIRRGLNSKKFILRSAIIRQNGLRVIGNIYGTPHLLASAGEAASFSEGKDTAEHAAP